MPLWRTPEDKLRLGAPTILIPPRDGTSIDVDAVLCPIEDACERWDVQRVVLDPSADGEHLAQRIERELGVDVTAHSQRPEPMSMAAQRFTAALRAGTLEHPADPRLTEHVLAAVPKAAGERWRFTRHRRPIDALIAAAMAVSVEVDAAEHGDSIYEHRSLIVIETRGPPDNDDGGTR